MARLVAGGHTTYGHPIGILMLETRFPRLPGDIGHAETFDFPVLYDVIAGAVPDRLILERDKTLLDPFVDGARRLERAGVWPPKP